jgi:hypothetical protein
VVHASRAAGKFSYEGSFCEASERHERRGRWRRRGPAWLDATAVLSDNHDVDLGP